MPITAEQARKELRKRMAVAELDRRSALPERTLMRFEAAPKPSLFRRAISYVFPPKEPQMPVVYDLPEGRKYRVLPPTREEQPFTTLKNISEYYAARYISGLGMYAPDIIAHYTTGAKSFAEALNQETGFIPTRKEEQAGSFLEFMGGIKTATKAAGAVVRKIPIRATAQRIISGMVAFGSRATAEEVSKKITEDRPISPTQIGLETGIGGMFGLLDAAVGRVKSEFAYKKFIKAHPEAKAYPKKLLLRANEAMSQWFRGLSRYVDKTGNIPVKKQPQVLKLARRIQKMYGKDLDTLFGRMHGQTQAETQLAIAFKEKVGVSSEVADKAIEQLRKGVPVAEVDRALSLAKVTGQFAPEAKKPLMPFVKAITPEKPPTVPTPAKVTKEPWEMTSTEFAHKFPPMERAEAAFGHKLKVYFANKEGKPVPREVLEEYKSEEWAQEALTPTPAKPTRDIRGGLNAAQKLTNLIKIAKPIPGQTEVIRHKERQKRVAMYEKNLSQALKQGISPEEALTQARRAFAGPYKGAGFQPPAELGFMEVDRQELFQQIATSDLPAFRRNNANDALLKVLAGTDNITDGDINVLEEVFGPELAKAIVSKRPLGQRARAFALDAIGLPKAFIASFDLSAPLRQGAWLLPGHPVDWSKSFASMIKTAVPGGKGIIYATEAQVRIKNDPLFPLAERSGLYIAPLFEAGSKLTRREEQFMTRLAQKVPGIKWAERTYVTFLNQMRFNVFQSTVKKWQEHGRTFEKYPQDYKAYARWINYMTGRGALGKKLGWLGPELNAIFFSPRYRISRIQIPYSVGRAAVKGQGYVLKEQAKDLVAAVGTGLTILTLASLAGHDVEDDPRSADWGKIKIKGTKTRIDMWAGMQQPARTVIRSMMKERKSTTTGIMYPTTPLEEIGAYTRSGMSPIGGLAWDILATETYRGEEMTLEPATFKREIYHRGTPIFFQDVIDTIRYEDNYESLLPIVAPVGFLGVGVQTYEPTTTPFKKKKIKPLKFKKKAG